MSAYTDTLPSDDLSALAWVQSELRRTLDNAHKSLRRYLKEAEAIGRSDVDSADLGLLRSARAQVHQGVGALELVGLPPAARVLRAAESALQRVIGKPALLDEAAVQTIERVSFALLDYLGRLLAGKTVSPVALFPQYRDAQLLAGSDRIHPADLWDADLQWHELPAEPGITPCAADDGARSRMESIVLALVRKPEPRHWARMSDLCASLAAGFGGRSATLWRLGAAAAQAHAAGLLSDDLYAKRLSSRLLAQLRLDARGAVEPSDRLAQDLLFFCANAQAPSAAQPAPRLAAVRRLWRSGQAAPIEYETARLGRFDPAWITQARKRVAGAKDVWSAVAAGEMHRLAGLGEQFALLGDSIERLFPGGAGLARALQESASRVVDDGEAPSTPLAMEVATSVLYIDATLEDGDLDHPDLQARMARLAQRINQMRGGADPQPLEPWMEELYRRVSDRQTMGSVVQELRSSLSEVEKQIDQYFRDPSQRELLIPVPNQLSAMRGVLSVLGMDQASQAVLHMRDDVDAMASTEVDPQQAVRAGTFDRLADNLGALSFLIDMLAVQPQLAKSLFRFDPDEGSLSAVMGQSARPSAFGALDEGETSDHAPLVEDTRALARSVAEVPSEEVTQRLEQLSQRALAEERPAVAGAISRAQTALQQADDPLAREAAAAELAQHMDTLAPPPEAETATLPLRPPSPPMVAAPPAPAAGAGDLEDDPEMREVFLEEAREVIESARESLARLSDSPAEVAELTTVRRAFHTLKGSSRMVGLRDYGEAAWACEQLYNARLAQVPRMDEPLREFTEEALAYLGEWTDAIAAGAPRGHHSAPVVQSADALRLHGRRVPLGLPGDASTAPAVAAPVVPAAPPAVPPAGAALSLAWPPVESPAAQQPAVPTLPLAAVPAGDEPRPLIEIPHDDAPAVDRPAAVELPTLEHAAPESPPGTYPPLTLPVVDEVVPEAPAVAEANDLSLSLELPLLDEDLEAPAEPAAPAESLPDLAERVPGLPSAFDLELEPPPVAIGPEPPSPVSGPPAEPAPPAPELEFEFDLGAEGPPVAETLPSPSELADVVELDFGDFEQAGAVPGPAADLVPQPLPGEAAVVVPGTETLPLEPALRPAAAEADVGPSGSEFAALADEFGFGGAPEPAPAAVEPAADLALPVAEGLPGAGAEPERAADLAFGSSVPVTEAFEPAPAAPVEPEHPVDLVFEPAASIDADIGIDVDNDVGPAPPAESFDLPLPSAWPQPVVTPAAAWFEDEAPEEPLEPIADDRVAQPAVAEAIAPLETEPAPPDLVTALAPDFAPDLAPDLALDLGPELAQAAEPEAPQSVFEPAAGVADIDEPVKVIGDLRIPIPLFNIYLNEADELSRRLGVELAEWGVESERHPVQESTIALAHSLAGSSATVGYADLSTLARALEHALLRSAAIGHGSPGEPELFSQAADEIRRLLHQFAAGFLRPMDGELLELLAEHERSLAEVVAGAADEDLADTDEALADAGEPLAGGLPLPEAWVPAAGESDSAEAGFSPVPDLPIDVPLSDGGAPPEAVDGTLLPTPVDRASLEPPAGPMPEEVAPAGAAEPWAVEPAPGSAPAPEPQPQAAATGFAPLAALAPSFGALESLPQATSHVGRARADAFDDDQDIDALDAIDPELFPIFEEEAEELLPQLQSRLREWVLRPSDRSAASGCMRTLHTFKGGARLAGAMRLGEMAHRLETAIEHLTAQDTIAADAVEPLLGRVDAMAARFDALRRPAAAAAAPAAEAPPAQPVAVELPLPAAEPGDATVAPARPEPVPEPQPEAAPAAIAQPALEIPVPLQPAAAPAVAPQPRPQPQVAIDWSRFSAADLVSHVATTDPRPAAAAPTAVRVRAGLLDRLVNHAGEVSITRARIDADVHQLQGSLNDLTDNLDRLRRQLRDIELQAETQITSRMEAAKAASQAFDPLEMDRFTRFQELTRMMAESVNDVATVQRSVQRTLQSTEDQLASQARLTRELQDDLLRTRMVEFESLADRLYRVVRQAAKDTGKQVRLDIVGGAIEVDRGVLERMVGPFEHLLRNSVAHGIEAAEARRQAGKEPTGSITITVTQEGNEVGVECRDDGAGLDLARIRQRAEERGLIGPGQAPADAELANLVFLPGFSTATEVTELAGRGVGLDVVRAEVNAMGGRIETASTPGQGTSLKLLLPLTTAVTQVVMLRCGDLRVAVPSTLVEIVRRVPTSQVEPAYTLGVFPVGDEGVPFFWLGALLQHSVRGPSAGRSQAIVIVRSALQRVALHVDEVVGNQEVVVKHVGPQLARLPGLAGVTLLPSGAVALIYNPVALAALYGESARQRALAPPVPVRDAEVPVMPERQAPLVLVVDDSLTVRRVTQRLLAREGYRVALAKDGMEALERLAEERPALMLSDIEMPRMDGFDLLRNVRADARLADLPVVMITSRIAQRHRDYAQQLGVDHYLGKPYSEDELLALVARYAGADIAL